MWKYGWNCCFAREFMFKNAIYMQEVTASRLTPNIWSFISHKIPHSHTTQPPRRTEVATSPLKLKVHQQTWCDSRQQQLKTVTLPHFDTWASVIFSFSVWSQTETIPCVCVGPHVTQCCFCVSQNQTFMEPLWKPLTAYVTWWWPLLLLCLHKLEMCWWGLQL